MGFLKVLRLLLDVLGALFILIIIGGAIFAGLLPHQTFVDIGALGFYSVVGFAIALWLLLAALLGRRAPPVTPPASR